MEKSLNLSLIEGRLTSDPDFLNTKSGYPYCKFDVAVNFNMKSGNGKVINEVSFISVNTWNKVALACSQYLKKGSKVRIRGRLKQNSWNTKEGEKRRKITVEAASVEFLGSPKRNTEPITQSA
jgi:single-strand DNA-binding protein